MRVDDLVGMGALVMYIVASLLIILHAFRSRFWWGIAVVSFPFAGVMYAFTYLHAKHPALRLCILSFFLLVLAVFVPPTWWMGC